MQKVSEIKETDISGLVDALVDYFWVEMDKSMCYNLKSTFIKFYNQSDFFKHCQDIIVYYLDGKYKPTEVLLKACEVLLNHGYNVNVNSDRIRISWNENKY